MVKLPSAKNVKSGLKILLWTLLILGGLFSLYFFVLVPLLAGFNVSLPAPNWGFLDSFKTAVTTNASIRNLVEFFWPFENFLEFRFLTEEFPIAVSSSLGFGATYADFVYHFFIGLISGFILFSLYKVFSFFESAVENPNNNSNMGFLRSLVDSGFKGSWMEKISDKIWKPFLIAVVYGSLMQVPLLNVFLDFILLRPFGAGVSPFLIAFYIGILPTAYWAYRRFKLIKYYQSKLLQKRYEAQAMQALTK